jgi:hypothetical protein
MPRGGNGWIDRQRQTERHNEDNKRFSLFTRVRTKIKILKIVMLHVTLGGVFSFKEETHPMGTRE